MKYVLLATCACIVASSPAHAKDGVRFDQDGLTIEAADGNFELTLGGRLHLDAARFDLGEDEGTDADVRRARLELRGGSPRRSGSGWIANSPVEAGGATSGRRSSP